MQVVVHWQLAEGWGRACIAVGLTILSACVNSCSKCGKKKPASKTFSMVLLACSICSFNRDRAARQVRGSCWLVSSFSSGCSKPALATHDCSHDRRISSPCLLSQVKDAAMAAGICGVPKATVVLSMLMCIGVQCCHARGCKLTSAAMQ